MAIVLTLVTAAVFAVGARAASLVVAESLLAGIGFGVMFISRSPVRRRP